MPQRTTPCGISLGVCRLRVTKIDGTTGCVTSEADNSFVLGDITTVQVAPNVETGADLTLINGCGCKIATYKAQDILKRFDLTLTTPVKSAALESLLTDGGVLFDNSTSPVPVGYSNPTDIDCDDQQPVAVEFWTKNWVDDAQDGDLPWIHWVYPYSLWTPGSATAGNDFANPDFVGFTRSNDCWGDGPYGDGPEAIYGASDFSLATGGWFYTPEDPPEATCDFGTVTPAS